MCHSSRDRGLWLICNRACARQHNLTGTGQKDRKSKASVQREYNDVPLGNLEVSFHFPPAPSYTSCTRLSIMYFTALITSYTIHKLKCYEYTHDQVCTGTLIVGLGL